MSRRDIFLHNELKKKSTDVQKVSLHLSTQAFNERYSCLYKKSHLYFSKICFYLSLRFKEHIKTTNYTRLSVLLLKMLCTSLTSIAILSPDFHFSFPGTTIILKLMNLLLMVMQKFCEVCMAQASWYVSDSLNPHYLLLWPEQSVGFALGVWHPSLVCL